MNRSANHHIHQLFTASTALTVYRSDFRLPNAIICFVFIFQRHKPGIRVPEYPLRYLSGYQVVGYIRLPESQIIMGMGAANMNANINALKVVDNIEGYISVRLLRPSGHNYTLSCAVIQPNRI